MCRRKNCKCQQGDGIKDVVNALLPTRKQFPPKVRKIIKDNSDKRIVSITVGRNPVQKKVTTLLNLLSLGRVEEAQKDLNYDLYHLFMLVGLEDGKTLLVEKNAVVNMEYVQPNYHAKDRVDVDVSGDITFGEMIENAVNNVGTDIYLYNAQTNNCQVFISNLLMYSGLLTDELSGFISQDIVKVLESSPSYIEQITNMATELGAKWDRFVHGEGKRRRRRT